MGVFRRCLSGDSGHMHNLFGDTNVKLEKTITKCICQAIPSAITSTIKSDRSAESYGKTVLLIGGRRALKAAEEKIRTYVAKTNLEIIGVERYGSDCTYETVEKLRQLPVYHKADMVFGVGGGKALDTVKCLCITD